jgi:hypothetical protein
MNDPPISENCSCDNDILETDYSDNDLINNESDIDNSDIDEDDNNDDDQKSVNLDELYNKNFGNQNSDNDEKIKIIVKDIKTLKCKLQNITQDGDLAVLIQKRVYKSNKIILEGTYLFYVYLLHILSNNIKMDIKPNTIRRCMRYLITDFDKSKSNKVNDKKEEELILSVKDKFFHFSNKGRGKDFSNDEKGLMKPIEASADMFYTNLKIHIARNFKRYQKKYLKCKLSKFITKTNSKTNIRFLLHALQQKINVRLIVIQKKKVKSNSKNCLKNMIFKNL